jgi:hypothetical protein
MKYVLLLATIVVSPLVFAQNNALRAEDLALIDILRMEGVYELEATYITPGVAKVYPALDRMVILRSVHSLSFTVALSQKDIGQPFIFFENVEIKPTPSPNEVTLSGEGKGMDGKYGEIDLQIDLRSGEYRGTFSDSLASGYKILKGTKIISMARLLYAEGRLMSLEPLQLLGVYEGTYGNRPVEFVVRKYSSGTLSGFFHGTAQPDSHLNINFLGEIIQPENVMGLTSQPTGVMQVKLSLVPIQLGDQLILRGFSISTAGIYLPVELKKIGPVYKPGDGIEGSAQAHFLR